MDFQQINRALHSLSTITLATQVLFHYDNPLTEREAAQLAEFQRSRLEQLEAGLIVGEIPDEMQQLASRPLHGVHPLLVVQCVMAASRLPHLPNTRQRVLQTKLLPYVAARTPLGIDEWCAALHASTHLPIQSSTASLQCVEKLISLSAPVIFPCPSTPGANDVDLSTCAADAEGVKASGQGVVSHKPSNMACPKLKSYTVSEAKLLLLKVLPIVARQCVLSNTRRVRHVDNDDLKNCIEEKFAKADRPHSKIIKRLRRVLREVIFGLDHNEEVYDRMREETNTLIMSLPPQDAVVIAFLLGDGTDQELRQEKALQRHEEEGEGKSSSLYGRERHPLFSLAVSKDQLSSTIKSHPGMLALFTDTKAGARYKLGQLFLSKPEEIFQFCLYNMRLNGSTVLAFEDYVSVLENAAPSHILGDCFISRGEDSIMMLFTPFINNIKILTEEVASRVSRKYVNLFIQAECRPRECEEADGINRALSLRQGLLQACVTMISNRCRAPPEKASIMRLVADIFQALLSDGSQPSVNELNTTDLAAVLDREMTIPAVESLQQAIRLVVLFRVEGAVQNGLTAALKTAKRDEAVRRTLLVHLAPGQIPQNIKDELVQQLLKDCSEAEVLRPDAYLALYFVYESNPDVVARLCPLLSTADVLNQLGGNIYELRRMTTVAIALARVGHFNPFAMLLTHHRGQIRCPLMDYIHSIANDTRSVATLWEHITQTVFGLDEEAKPRILSSTAHNAVLPVASALLRHAAKIPITTVLTEVLLCCGHDNVQGEDTFFYLPSDASINRHDKKYKCVRCETFEGIFSAERVTLLQQHGKAICASLLNKMLTAPEYMAQAACRGMVLLLTQIKFSSSEDIFEALLQQLRDSSDYFIGLSDMDAAIASESSNEMHQFEDAYLRSQQLLKSYPDRPPKGMTEDDFLYMKRKDAIALEKGREVFRMEITKRTKHILGTVRQHKHIFLTVRLMGITSKFDQLAIASFYPFLQQTLNQGPEKIPAILSTLALDAIVALLRGTPLRYLVRGMATIVARLSKEETLSAGDVAQVSTVAHSLRQAVTQMLPAPVFVVLVAFSRVAFRAGRGSNAISTTIPVATQHQILGLLLQNIGQSDLPIPTEAMELLSMILRSFPSLYKSVQQGIYTLMGMIPTSHLSTIESAMFNSTDAVREVTAAALHRFAHFGSCRRALVMAAVFVKDPSANVSRYVSAIVEDSRYGWSLQASDWKDLLYFLATYGQQQFNAGRVALTMKLLFSDASEEQQSGWIDDIVSVGGLASVVAMQLLSSTYQGEVSAKVMDYLCSLIEHVGTKEYLMKAVVTAGRVVLKDMSLDTLKKIASSLQMRLAKPPKDSTSTHKEQYLATSTIWLTIISCQLQEVSLLESIIEQQSRVLNNSNSMMVHRCVCECMIEITKNEMVQSSVKVDEFVEKCIKQTIHSGSYIKKKAHAWGLVGILHGLGLLSLRRYRIIEIIQTALHEKENEKSGAMVLLEVLCEVMGTIFEPYSLALSEGFLNCVADPDPKISECAGDAARVFMSNLSVIGLRQLIPKLVEGLSSKQAKQRVAPLNFIGYVAFCSPKQLAAALPEIMKPVLACLFDVNSFVSTAAYNALRRVAGVVSNPEIQEHVDLILRAMRSPSTDTESALDALLYTRFVNAVDPASLALIIFVLYRGLGAQMPHTRPKAAQIVASMVSLVNDPKTLLPYSEELVHLLEEAAMDPQAEARTTSAKAIGALASAVGGPLVDEVMNWCFATMQKIHSSAIEKAGAAQAFVELVNACGDSLLESCFATIEAGMTDEKPPVREGFLYIMIYAPSTLSSETFQTLLPLAFPWVLEGLSHFSDKVRDVALVAGDSIISLYGTRNLSLVLEPLLRGVSSEVTTLRQSSLLLSSKLLLHLVAHIKKKTRIQAALDQATSDQDREQLMQAAQLNPDQGPTQQSGSAAGPAGDENGTDAEGNSTILTMEAAREVEKRGVSILGTLEWMLGTDSFVRLLSAIYCGRHEHSVNVRNDTNMAWQACVASIRAAVNKIFDGLVCLLVHLGSSCNPDCEEVAAKTIEFSSRMQETIDKFVVSFCDTYKEGSHRAKLGSLNGLATIVQFADSKRLMGLGGQIIGCVLPGMQDKDEAVQEAARRVFARVTKIVGPRLIENAVEAQLSTSVRGVVEVVKVKPKIALTLVFKYLNSQQQFTETHLELVQAIIEVEEASEEIRKYYDDVSRLLLEFLVQGVRSAKDVMIQFIEILPREFEGLPIDYIQKALRVPQRRHGALLAAEAFGLGTHIDNTDGISAVLLAVIDACGDEDEEIRHDAVRMLPKIISSLERRIINELSEEEQQDVTASKRASGRYLLNYLEIFCSTVSAVARASMSETHREFSALGEGEPRLFDVLMSFYNRGLDYGTPQQKVEAVEGIQDLLAFAPRAISAAAANTVSGRCSKVLFTRNEGAVVLALVQLCLQLMSYPASGKEKLVEGTMALAMFNAALCDSGEARTLTLYVVIELLSRSEKYADLILGTVVTKKSAVDTPMLRTVMCRFISTVIRYSNFTKAFPHIAKLMDVVRPLWDHAETPAVAAAAGVAVGALCKSATITDDVLSDIKEITLETTSAKGVQALAGFALVYSLISCAPDRTDQSFLDAAAEHLSMAAGGVGSGSKLMTLWVLRAAGAIATTGSVAEDVFRVDAYVPFFRRVSQNDEVMMSTAQYFHDAVSAVYPAKAALLAGMHHERSRQWNRVGQFDADLDDELEADSVY
ncbi:unnamed protein product [Phytomonas sp. EM1]|nr:unnamed protein product [Phytomonas sp. EM1]|eukprot:CCW61256.1 unnamed protein product [Phytomonas sp. isolate EM1]